MSVHQTKKFCQNFCKALHALGAEFLFAFAVLLFVAQPVLAQVLPVSAVICGAQDVAVEAVNVDQDDPCPDCGNCEHCLASAEQANDVPKAFAVHIEPFVPEITNSLSTRTTKRTAYMHNQMLRGPPSSICTARRARVFS